MNKYLKGLLLVALLCFVNALKTEAQSMYANREWVQTTPVVGTGYYHTSTIVVSGKLVITGNIINGSGNTDIYTLKLDTNGDTLWSATYAGSAGGDDYGIELKSSQDGYIYVAGAAKNTSTGYDYCLIKYNATTGAQVWVRNWNGIGNGDDIPSNLIVDGSSAIYVTGGSEASNGFSDFGTIKVSNLNVLNWAKYYNYTANLHDGATSISFSGGDVVVSGGSAAAVNDWDIATVKYNKLSGAAGTPTRTGITGATMTEANAMTTDSLNNVYIAGYAEISGNKNIQVIKLDSALSLKWIRDYSGTLSDIAYDIAVDSDENVYVTGYTEESAGKYKGITIKYKDNGDTLWTNLYGNTITEDGVKFRKMAVDSNGDVYVTGSAETGSQNSFSFVKYDTEGELTLTKKYQSDSLNDDGYDIGVDGNNVYITGFTETISGTRMTTIKYSLKEKDNSMLLDSTTGKPLYVGRDLIVRVDSSLIDKDKINQLEISFWTLNEIFDSSFVSDLERNLETSCGNNHCPVTVYRIFNNMRTTDTISISRSGDTIAVPQFWTAFVFEFPDGVDLTDASNDIIPLFPDIKYSTYNLVGTMNTVVPNDPDYYNGQISLHDDASPQPGWSPLHINVEDAWELETGKRFVKVGVYDKRIYWTHEDFGGADEATTKMRGYDFLLNDNIYALPLPTSPFETHGTCVAGIIGAIRNNELGVAGIAGGSYEYGENLDSSGCALYDMAIGNYTDTLIILSHVANAVYGGSVYIPGSDYNYGLNIMNHSWGVSNDLYWGMSNPWFLDTNIVLLRESFHFANRNKVTVVASRGNSGLLQDGGTYHYNYPGVLDDDWIICAGGMGTDGNYHNMDHPFEYTYKTSRGPEIDVSCYSSGSHNWTTTYGSSWYNTFNGTSAAAPHIAGTSALLLSYLNYPTANYANLAPEDVEYILQMTAIDRDSITHPGYDTLTGFGLVNAGGALNQVKKDRYTVAHFGTDMFPDNTDHVLYSTNDTVTLSERYENEAGDWFLPNVPYIVDTYKIISQSGHQIFSNEIVVAQWPRPSSSNVFAHFDTTTNVLMPRERIVLDSTDYIWGYMHGFIYRVKDTLGNPLGWWPFDTTFTFDLTYTLLKYDTAYYLNNPETYEAFSAKVYPNPAQNGQVLILNIDQPIDGSVRLVDINGRLIQTIYDGHFEKGQMSFNIDLGGLNSGMYIYAILPTDGRPRYIKVIKH